MPLAQTGGQKRMRQMNLRRIGRLAAVGLAVALAVPAVASPANEATKWNEIAVSTVNSQPPLASSPAAVRVPS